MYRFFLAFENSVDCIDYVTEKFWINSLYVGCVPVVWGPNRTNVARMAPKNSFVHVKDFDYDPKRLAEYLKKVDKDEKEFKKFFRCASDRGGTHM